MMKLSRITAVATLVLSALTLNNSANATTVEVETSLGRFEINLLDQHTPETVENFLEYVEERAYDDSFIHRSVDDFMFQGGGYTYNPALDEDGEVIGIENIESYDSVRNEPKFSNVRGTIAMAKVGGNAHSATNQWFINFDNNSENLDNQNGGFTVFGVITNADMEIVDDIARLKTYKVSSTFTDLPLRELPGEDEYITDDHLVMVHSITVGDPQVDTNPVLPPLSTSGDDNDDDDSDSSGGSMPLFGLLSLVAAAIVRKQNK